MRLRRTGRLLGFLACAIPADRPWLEFYRQPPLDRMAGPDTPLEAVPTFRLVWDFQLDCLWADGSEFLRLYGATPA